MEEKMAQELQNWLLPNILPGVIHEINNPLGVLIMNVSMLKEDFGELENLIPDSETEAFNETFQDMTLALERINGIVKSLGFVSMEKNFIEPTGIDVKYLVLHALNIYHTRIKRAVSVTTEFPSMQHLFTHVAPGKAIGVMVKILEALIDAGGDRDLKVTVTAADGGEKILCSFTRNGRAIGPEYDKLTEIEEDENLSLTSLPDGYQLLLKPHAQTTM